MIDLDALSPEDRALAEQLIGQRKASDAVKPAQKYHAVPTEYKNRRYDSKAEARRAEHLDLLVGVGHVAWWIPQVTIRLGDISYRVDFVVAVDPMETGAPPEFVVVHAEDVKGFETPRFKMCKKLWPKYGPFDLHVIRGGEVEIVDGRGK